MANEHESIKKKKKRKRRREETPPVSADEGAAKQKGGGTAGKKRAGEEATAGPPKGKKRRRDESSEEEPEQQPSTPSTAEPGDGDGAGDGGVWRRRVRQLVQAAADAQEFAALSATLREWDQTDVAELIQDWEPGAVANLIQEWPAATVAVLLRGSPSRRGPAFIAQVCEGCAPDDVIPLLPLLGRKLARKVLDRLFFEAADPYLSVGEAKRCLMAFGQKDRKKLIKKIRNAKAVAKVLDADSDDDSAGLSRGGDDDDDSGEDLRAGGAGGLVDDGGGGGSADDDSQYEGSFIDDGPIEEESYSEPGWSGSDEDA